MSEENKDKQVIQFKSPHSKATRTVVIERSGKKNGIDTKISILPDVDRDTETIRVETCYKSGPGIALETKTVNIKYWPSQLDLKIWFHVGERGEVSDCSTIIEGEPKRFRHEVVIPKPVRI